MSLDLIMAKYMVNLVEVELEELKERLSEVQVVVRSGEWRRKRKSGGWYTSWS